jgi:PAS domain S-box-containing protein
MDVASNINAGAKVSRTLLVMAGLVSLSAIIFLTWNVSREITALGTATSDNVEWSLSQTEVEYLEFARRARLGSDLTELRRRFDVFYSRIKTVSDAQVFAVMRNDPEFTATLAEVEDWLDQIVPIIDGTDVELTASIPTLASKLEDIRTEVRVLSNSGLKLFASKADLQRQGIAQTMFELALALAALISALGLSVIYLIRLNRQVSERERAERQTGARMNTVINTSLDGVIVSDNAGIIVEFSPAAEEIFKHRAADVIGRELGAIIVPDHLRGAHDAGMERMRRGGAKHVVGKGRVRLEAKRSDGSIFPVELALQSATTDDGDIYIAFLRDLTQQMADEAELVEARDKAIAGEKSRAEFLATMSHEIRTPLNGILGHMSLLRDTTLTGKQDVYLRNMETSSRLLMSHVSDVLDISRYDAGKVSATLEPVNVSDLLQDIIDSQSGMASAQETTLDWGWDGPSQHWVFSDGDRLQHILMNLIGNALKFTKRGRVSVTVNWHADQMSIAIEDTGIGIPAELQGHIFEDFVTGNTAYDREVGGSGLGLSIAQRFVSVLKGEISFTSQVGTGTTFRVTFPATLAQAPAPAKAVPQGQIPNTPLRILVVEDNEINRFLVREMLQADGHTVVEAHDGQQGVDLAAAEHFDLILMDISMPVLDGRSATRQIRDGGGACARTRIVALTANALAEERQVFLSDGMDDVLTKPLTKSDLREILAGSGASPPKVSRHIVDLAHNAETKEVLGAEAYLKVLGRFKAEVDQLISWLQQSQSMDRTDIAAEVHKIAGNAALFGAQEMRDALLHIENAAKTGSHQDVEQGIALLPDIWRRSKAALAEI